MAALASAAQAQSCRLRCLELASAGKAGEPRCAGPWAGTRGVAGAGWELPRLTAGPGSVEALGAICGCSRLSPRDGDTCRSHSCSAAEERGRPGCGVGGHGEPGLRHVLLASALGWGSLGSMVFKK